MGHKEEQCKNVDGKLDSESPGRLKISAPAEILDSVENSLLQIQRECQNRQLDIKNVGLTPLFKTLRDCTTPGTLYRVAGVFGIGCDLLEEKFRRVQAFIQLIDNPDEIVAFFTNYFDFETTLQFLSSYWIKCPEVPGASAGFFKHALDRLNSLQISAITLTPPETPPPPDHFEILLPGKRFEEMKEELVEQIAEMSQPTIGEVLRSHIDPEEYYETFMIILHLIQDGRVKYIPLSQSLEVAGDE
ncbi:MAG TPA: hypothetical protein VKK79_07270 [Candidatus Lokiarchaeia archaeon]|nr:hypothetical protein [Candidatus Lokiarchaeia archaeon]